MSYILDALKRADQERKQGEIPDLKSVSPAISGVEARQRNLLWPVMAVAAAAAAFFLYKPWHTPETAVQAPKQIDTPVIPATRPLQPTAAPQPKAASRAEKMEAKPVTELLPEAIRPSADIVTGDTPTATAAADNVSASGSENATTRNNAPALPGIMELPASIRDTLPAIAISAHIYDEKPASRMVIINNRVMREGNYINDSLRIEEITKNGLILSSAGTRFFMSPFDSWSN